jgi:hypothetical protein
MYHFVQKYGLGYLLGDFFTNSSGHPDCECHRKENKGYAQNIIFNGK